MQARQCFRTLAAAGAIAAGLACDVSAHHSFSAEFDIDQPVMLTGTVTEMKWSNPHTWIYIDVVDEDGNVVNWALETPRAANMLIRNGWRREDLPAGRVITVEGWQARNGSATANISSVTLEDGRQLFAGAPEPEGRQR
jgi:DNA/RNA endonuclease YhcR with UshA esterase domain